MTTIDNVVQNVKNEFDGDLTKSHLDYERAVQGLKAAEERIADLEESIKSATGYSDVNLPRTIQTTELDLGEVQIAVRSETRTKRPAYKKVVERMEEYLSGIASLLFQGKRISAVHMPGKTAFIDVETLLTSYEIIVAGITSPEVKHTIRYKTAGKLDNEGIPESVRLGEEKDITPETAAEYVRLNRLTGNLADFAEQYEAALEPDKTTKVTQKKAYAKESAAAQGPDWAYVVTTLITVPTRPDHEGELNLLADPNVSKAEKERTLPDYRLEYGNGSRLYVSLQSVHNRIQDLKAEQTITADRTKVNGKEIV